MEGSAVLLVGCFVQHRGPDDHPPRLGCDGDPLGPLGPLGFAWGPLGFLGSLVPPLGFLGPPWVWLGVVGFVWFCLGSSHTFFRFLSPQFFNMYFATGTILSVSIQVTSWAWHDSP